MNESKSEILPSGSPEVYHGAETDSSVGNIWTSVLTFDQLDDARQMESALKKNGFETRIQNESRLQRYWFGATPQASVHIQVRSRDQEKVCAFARNEPEVRNLSEKVIRCPSCHSSRIQYPAMTRKSVVPALVLHLLVMLGLQKYEYYCEDCHFTWDRDRAPSPSTAAS